MSMPRRSRFRWALDRTRALGLSDLMLHAGFLPEPGDPDRKHDRERLNHLHRGGEARRDNKEYVVGHGTGRQSDCSISYYEIKSRR